MTTESFVRALGENPPPNESAAVESLFKALLAQCSSAAGLGPTGLEVFGLEASKQPSSVGIARKALLKLSPKDRALLLLRDQCHLPFERIAGIIGSAVRETRSDCLAAREHLRTLVQALIEGGGGHAV